MTDEHTCLKNTDLIPILRDLEMITGSLKRISACHPEKVDRPTYDRMMNEFIEQWDVCRRLDAARDILVRSLYQNQGEAGRTAFQDEMEDVSYWYMRTARG